MSVEHNTFQLSVEHNTFQLSDGHITFQLSDGYNTFQLSNVYNLFILLIYLHFIYRWQYIKTHDLKVQLNCIAVQIIRYMHAN